MADTDLQIRGGGGGGGHPDPEIRGRGPGLKKMFFSAPTVWSKKGGGGRGPSPGSATTIGFYV